LRASAFKAVIIGAIDIAAILAIQIPCERGAADAAKNDACERGAALVLCYLIA